jgi:hypothetical protein
VQSSFDILSGVFKILNPVLKTEISGKVIIGDEEMGDQNENVCINLLNNRVQYLQEGFLNINVHIMGINEDVANLKRMKELVDLIFPLVNEKEHYFEDHQITLHLNIEDDKGVFKSQESKGKFFYNIKINYLTL